MGAISDAASNCVEGPRDLELGSIIDDELTRLPELFRVPFILCDLEGKTHADAAQLLGVPVGTLSSRLARGRERLRRRLVRRGLEPAAVTTATSPSRYDLPSSVPPALVATTARTAARFALNSTLAGAAPADLAVIAADVIKAMTLAKIVSKLIVLSATLSLAMGAVAVGFAAQKYLGFGQQTGATSFPTDNSTDAAREWSWIDNLENADAATRARLKRTAIAATTNFASLHRLVYDFDLQVEAASLGNGGKTASIDRGFFRGTVYWGDGSVRYDKFSLGKLGPNGEKFFYKKPKVYSVLRTRDTLAYTEENPAWGLFLTVTRPPQSDDEWEFKSHAYHRKLDPWLYYAQPFCTHKGQLRDFWEHCSAIESDEADGRVVLKFARSQPSWRVEITCSAANDWLPELLRGGEVKDGKWNPGFTNQDEWRKVSGVWYPSRHVEIRGWGIDNRPVKEIDLTVRNFRANAAADLPEALFTLSAMEIPAGTPGLDRRTEPFRWLIKAGGVVRQPRSGEMPNNRSDEEGKVAEQQAEETISADDPSVPRLARDDIDRSALTAAAASNAEYLSLLEEYERADRQAEKAFLAAQTDAGRLDAFRQFGPLEWSYAGRFLAFARKHAGDDTSIDALGHLVAARFTPPEAETAADILIRDYLQSDKLFPIYRRLASADAAWSTAGERLLRAVAERGSTPEARGRAILYLGFMLQNRASSLKWLRSPEPNPLMQLEAAMRSGGQKPAVFHEQDPDALCREAEQLFDRAIQGYGAIKLARGTLGDAARIELFRLRDLAIGKLAPEIDGQDVDGQRFRLSDYRGKVVVVTFSGNWCGPCRAMYPHDRELVERMKDRPFVLLSANTDDDRETLRKSLKSGEITWRCWWEGGVTRPNLTRWHVVSIPSVFVLDPHGIIRAKDVRGKAIDEVVDRLVKEAETNSRPRSEK
jgi:thiol-disulfide isomerase/thioredoxin